MPYGKAYIVFELDGNRYEYDGGIPYTLAGRFSGLRNSNGTWIGGYPKEVMSQQKDERDELPIALWEIEQIGGAVIEVSGVTETGAIHWEDWRRPRIY